jgi:hypothetical protein
VIAASTLHRMIFKPVNGCFTGPNTAQLKNFVEINRHFCMWYSQGMAWANFLLSQGPNEEMAIPALAGTPANGGAHISGPGTILA